MAAEAKQPLLDLLARMGLTPTDSRIRWRHTSALSRSFGLRAWLTTVLLPFLPPVRGWKVRYWVSLLVIPAILAAEIWYISENVPGSGSNEVLIRWVNDIGCAVIFLLGFIPFGRATDGEGRRAAAIQDPWALLVGDVYVVALKGRLTAIRVSSIRRTWRLMGIAALETESGKYTTVPADLFFDHDDWAAVRRRWPAAPSTAEVRAEPAR